MLWGERGKRRANEGGGEINRVEEREEGRKLKIVEEVKKYKEDI